MFAVFLCELRFTPCSPLIFAFSPYPTGNCALGGAVANWQSYTSHEIMEAATDPYPGKGWVETKPGGGGTDEGGDESGNVTDPFPFGVVQRFSNSSGDTPGVPSFTTWSPLLRPHLAVTSWGVDRLDAFVRGKSGGVLHQMVVGAEPMAPTWVSLGAISTTDSPCAVSWGPYRIDVFARSSSGSLLHKYLDDETWGPTKTTWQPLGGIIVGPPVAVSWGPGRLDVFAVGKDCALWHWGWDKGPKGWARIGGLVVGPPSVVSWAPGRLDIFIRSVDGRVYHKAGDGYSWQPEAPDDWESLDGQVIDVPVAVSTAPGRLDVFAKGTGAVLCHRAWQGQWEPEDDWEPLGGSARGTHAAVAHSGGLHVFCQGDDRALYHTKWAGGWDPWEYRGGTLVGGPVAISRGSGIDVLVQGGSGALNWKRLNDSGSWSGWEGRGGTLG
jgi:hypothetical protein